MSPGIANGWIPDENDRNPPFAADRDENLSDVVVIIAGMQRPTWTKHPLVTGRSGSPDVVRVAELEEIGMPRSSIYRRCLPGGPWRRLLPGVILLHPSEPTDEQRLRAGLLRGGEDSMITGLWALRRHGLREVPAPSDVHLLVPHEREVTSAGFAVVERTTRLPNAVTRDGLPVAPVHRAVLDGARRIRDFDTVQGMLAEAVQRRKCTPEQLDRELCRGSQRGSAIPRRALQALLAGAESVAEGDAWEIWKLSGLPPAEWNVNVFDRHGRFLSKPDAWCEDLAFAWEIDSRKFHEGGNHYATTLARNARYSAAGIVCLQTLPSRLRTEPRAVIAELCDTYAAACARPRPPVTSRP
ncbi:hypothetical protein [Amycolatopsis sp. cmx-4-61]|uniref:hypothetical protein n=1 Tax=Amycolatopsis sp. cmx-4-61 TaxID=2790937 RepID=UPI00397C5A67